MIMHEFGKENEVKVLLLHGAGCTYKMWTPQIEKLQSTYHLYVPSISGHEKGDIDFISSYDEAKKIISWFDENKLEVDLICGASLGAHIAAEILQIRPDFSKLAFIESLKGYKFKGLLLDMFCYTGKKILRKCANTDVFMSGTYKQKYASDDTKETIKNMSEISLQNIMIESGDYTVKSLPEKIKAKTLIVYGSKEEKECKSNTEILKSQIQNCTVEVIKGFKHGELAIGNPEKHIDMVCNLLGQMSLREQMI